MIDPASLRDNPAMVTAQLARRGYTLDTGEFTRLDTALRDLRSREENLRQRRNQLSKEIGLKHRDKDTAGAAALQEEAGVVADEVSALHGEVAAARQAHEDFMLRVPNLPDVEVPDGASEADNQVVRTVGTPPDFGFAPRDHVALGEVHGLLDLAAGSSMAQARFTVLAGAFANLHRALAQFMLDMHVGRHGYSERYVPYLVNTATMTNTGQLPRFGTDDEFFSAKADDLHLIPTAEVPLANLAAGRTFAPEELPLRMVAHSPCFRREAGSYGKDTRGMLRQHQFDKVELVQVAHPEQSAQAHLELTGHAEAVLKELGLAYQVVELCTGDLGDCAARTFDLEVWLPGQQAYREISSCSNDRDYQSRRMGARLRGGAKGANLVHLLNGSGVAVGRAFIAVLENYQRDDGTITVPDVLRPYMRGQEAVSAPA